MPTQKWRVVVAKLGTENVLYEGDVDASNWMSALRSARENMAERPSVPPGVSCSIDNDGVATVLDPGSRRRFVLAPASVAVAARVAEESPPPAAAQAVPAQPLAAHKAEAPAAQPAPPAQQQRPPRVEVAATTAGPNIRETAREAPAAKKKKFETVAFAPETPATRTAPEPAPPIAAPPAAAPPAAAPPPSQSAASGPPVELGLLLERNEEPTATNPLCYRERAFLLPKGTTVLDAEAALRWKLADLQHELETRPRGKLVNLAVFDHHWREVPERPPIITLQWRDWRGDAVVDYPAAARLSSIPPATTGHDDRLADVFEALEALSRLATPAEALDFAAGLVEQHVPSAAVAACLYDINTDELRFVALRGVAAAAMQGRAVARAAGLFGPAARVEHHATVFGDVLVEPAFNPEVDSRPGLDAHNALLRPIVHEHQLLGMLQLINRQGRAGFSAEDANLLNYIAERLAEFIQSTRRQHSQQVAPR